jgi:hypothetical protein
MTARAVSSSSARALVGFLDFGARATLFCFILLFYNRHNCWAAGAKLLHKFGKIPKTAWVYKPNYN